MNECCNVCGAELIPAYIKSSELFSFGASTGRKVVIQDREYEDYKLKVCGNCGLLYAKKEV